MTAHNTQKNLLVFGLAREALEALPVTGNMAAGGFAWTVALDLVPGLLLIPGALLLVAKRRAVQRVGHAVVLVRRRRWLPGGFLCAVGALALARAWPFTVDPYPPYSDLGLAPHQALIDYIDRLGGVTVCARPEGRARPARDAWRGGLGPAPPRGGDRGRPRGGLGGPGGGRPGIAGEPPSPRGGPLPGARGGRHAGGGRAGRGGGGLMRSGPHA